jgi:hypothetical protein
MSIKQEPGETEAIAEAMLPILTNNDNKNRYLTLRALGMTILEASKLIKVHLATIYRWRREDEAFNIADTEGLTDAKKKLANEFLSMEFVRNFHLALTKDFDVLIKAAMGNDLSNQEQEYLLKIRPQYTPQQLGFIKQLSGEIDKPDEMDFTKLTLTIRRERDEMIIQKEK